MTLDIVIVSFNARADLERCLHSLRAAPPALSHRIIVVDNASVDGSADAVRRAWPGVHVIELPTNAGFAAANNAGIRAGTGELVLLLNSDTIVPAGAIDGLAARLAREPGVAAAGPRLVDGEGRPEWSFGRMLTPRTEARRLVIGKLYAKRVPIVTRLLERATRRESYPDWVSGACLLVWRQAAEAAGLLDERFFMYEEDVDFCASLRALGGRILFTPAADVVHLRGRSARSAPAAARLAYHRSHAAFYAKHDPRWVPWLRVWMRLKGIKLEERSE
ncbi:MAG: glycosyltransferase family 2 protein [Vicinamibacterales bacterium]